MKKDILTVPRGIRYISEWDNFHLPVIPTIIDKQITGCGFTEYCIGCKEDVIICSPRVILLENKEDQHQGELFYVRNNLEYVLSIDCIDGLKKVGFKSDNSDDIKKILEKAAQDGGVDVETKTAEYYRQLRSSIIDYYRLRKSQNLSCKFIVTYDSFRHVKEALREINVIEDFYVVIDEFQSIFTDSRFKSTTELGFLKELQDLYKVCFVSATPMLDTYLDRLEQFNSLPMIQLDWKTEEPSRIISPQLIAKQCKSILTAIKPIIESYQGGRFNRFVYKDESGLPIEILSKELVIYVNSVKNICDIIRKFGLTLDNTNVLCARTSENRKKIKKAFGKIGKAEVLGTVPKKGEPHKMFTLCTRTVYLGADFYSTNARTVILSDANIECLAVDISLDLPQILGRQRLIENPWKNYAELYFKTSRKQKTKEEFDAIIQKKLMDSHNLLELFGKGTNDQQRAFSDMTEATTKATNYSVNYLAVDIKTGVKFPIINQLVLVAEQRAFDVQQIDYKDRFSVFNAVSTKGDIIDTLSIDECLNNFNNIHYFTDKFRYLCNQVRIQLTEEQFNLFLSQIPMEFKNYYILLGPEKCKALSYKKSELQKEYDRLFNNVIVEDEFSRLIYDTIKVGSKYKRSEIKDILNRIIKQSGKNITPKANLILDYFNIRDFQVSNKETGKRDHAYEILSIKTKNP